MVREVISRRSKRTHQSVGRLFALVTIVFVALVTSCHHHHDDYFPEPEANCQQTIMVFLPWAAQLQNAFNQNIVMIEKAVKANKGLHGQRLVVFRSSSSTEASLVEIVYGRDSCYHDTLKYYHNFRPMTVDGVAQIVSDMRRAAPSLTDKYGLIVGCHGMGWITVDNWNNARNASMSPNGPRRVIGGEQREDQMNVSDFAEGIARTDTKMQFVCFDDCYMAGIETAYDMRNVTTWLIASPCEIMAYGLPYDRLFADLTAIDGPNFTTVMQEFYNFYLSYSYPYATLAAIDCREVEPTAMLMRDINSQWSFDISYLQDLQTLDGLTPTIFFDMGDYVEKLCNDDELRTRMMTQLQKLVPYKTNTECFYSAYNGRATTIKTFSGITISDPSQNPKALAGMTESAWWHATH